MRCLQADGPGVSVHLAPEGVHHIGADASCEQLIEVEEALGLQMVALHGFAARAPCGGRRNDGLDSLLEPANGAGRLLVEFLLGGWLEQAPGQRGTCGSGWAWFGGHGCVAFWDDR
ncbi:hypothetical protein D9M68_838430 [compost metagenome]